MVFHQMDTEEVSDRFMALYFVNGLEAYDGENHLKVKENMILNDYVVKLCLEHEVKIGKKMVKKELIVALRGEIYFVKFIINPEEDNVEPGVIFGRTFLRMTKSITDFGAKTITIYPDIDIFLKDTEEEEKCMNGWDHLLDFNLDDIPLLGEELSPFVCKMGKSSHNKKRAMENLNLFYQDIGTSSSIGDGKIVKEEEEAVKRIKGEALKEKDNPRAFIFPIRLEGQVNENLLAHTRSYINTMPYRIYEQLGRKEMKKVDRGITMINHTQAEAMGILTNVLCQEGVTTLIAKFLILDIPIDRHAPIVVGQGFLRTIGSIVNTTDRLFSTFDGFCHQNFRVARFDVMKNAESDSNDVEEYEIKRNKYGASIYGPKPAPYLNCNDPAERSFALQIHVNWKPDYKGSYTKDEEATGQWRTEIRLTDPYENIYLQGFTIKKTVRKLSKHHKLSDIMSPNDAKSRYNTILAQLLPVHVYSSCVVNWDVVNRMGCDEEINDMLRIRLCEAESNKEIFTFVAWIRAFNINKLIYAELCHEFYLIYKFDEVYANDELQTKKIIKFRLGGRAYNLNFLKFARRLGLYHVDELEEDGFNVYFEGGLRSDEHFNAQEYWLRIRREENLGLSRSHTSTIKSLILRVIHKMITYGLCQRTTGSMKRKGVGTQKESQICCGQFISKIARKSRVLTDYVIRILSALIYCRDLDTNPLRDLIDSEGRLIPEDPIGMGRMEICQEAIERMEYMQSYHWDGYHGVFEHMAGVYSVPLQGAYNPPGYA
nr:hypothetical protein [Tanacetum cinerariifolium]